MQSDLRSRRRFMALRLCELRPAKSAKPRYRRSSDAGCIHQEDCPEARSVLEPSDLRVFFCFAHDVGMSFSPFTSQSAADFENIVLAPSISISWATLVGFVKCDVARTVRIRL